MKDCKEERFQNWYYSPNIIKTIR